MSAIGAVLNWFGERPGWVLFVLVAVTFALIFAADESIERGCNENMKLARTSRDSLDVRIACQKAHSDEATAIAIGAAAGAVAGSAAARSRP